MESLATAGSYERHRIHAANMEDHLGLGDSGAGPIVAGTHEVAEHDAPYVLGRQEAVGGLAVRLVVVGLMHLGEDPWRRTSNDLNGSLHTR